LRKILVFLDRTRLALSRNRPVFISFNSTADQNWLAVESFHTTIWKFRYYWKLIECYWLYLYVHAIYSTQKWNKSVKRETGLKN
jgi:hypothetical protein